MSKAPAAAVTDTSKRFGYQWDRYRSILDDYRAQFLGWIHPFRPESLRGKDVLDAGCGMGRNAYWMNQLGAKSVDAIDYGELAVASARELLAECPGVRVERRSIYDVEPEKYDVCISIGVVHHLEFPDKALKALVDALRRGGSLVVWLYGHEGNERTVALLRLVRPVTRRLPARLLHVLTYGMSIPLFLYLKLPFKKSEYLQSLRKYPLSHIHLIVFDQLVPEISRYYTREEVEELVADLPLETVEVHHNRGYSWTVVGRK